MQMLAFVLAQALGRTVVDETGLKGLFDMSLRWTPDTGAAQPVVRKTIYPQRAINFETESGRLIDESVGAHGNGVRIVMSCMAKKIFFLFSLTLTLRDPREWNADVEIDL